MFDTKISASSLHLQHERFKKHAEIFSQADYLCVGPIGSRYDYTTFYRTKDQGIWVSCGCFNNSINEFEKQVKKSHPIKSYFRAEYMDAIRMAKTNLERIQYYDFN